MAFALDKSLFDRAANQEPQALNALVVMLRPHIEKQLLRYPLADEDRRDLLQATLMQVVRRLGSFRGDSSFSTWLFRVTANEALMMMRSQRRHRARLVEGLDLEELGSLPAANDAAAGGQSDARAADQERDARVRSALAELPEDYRDVVVAHYHMDLVFRRSPTASRCPRALFARASTERGTASARSSRGRPRRSSSTPRSSVTRVPSIDRGGRREAAVRMARACRGLRSRRDARRLARRHRRRVQPYARLVGARAAPVETVSGFVGDGARTLLARATGIARDSAELDPLLAEWTRYYAANPVAGSSFMPGAERALQVLGSRGVKLALVTNKARAVALAVIEALGVGRAFSTVYAGGDGPLKPSAAPILRVCAALDVPPKDTWMVGDAEQDILAARAAGARAVAILGGFQAESRVRAASPTPSSRRSTRCSTTRSRPSPRRAESRDLYPLTDITRVRRIISGMWKAMPYMWSFPERIAPITSFTVFCASLSRKPGMGSARRVDSGMFERAMMRSDGPRIVTSGIP